METPMNLLHKGSKAFLGNCSAAAVRQVEVILCACVWRAIHIDTTMEVTLRTLPLEQATGAWATQDCPPGQGTDR